MILKEILQKDKSLNDWCILMGYRGSIAHGIYLLPENPHSVDDKDIMSICIPTKDHYFGLEEFGSRGTKEFKEQEWDIVSYELLKFIKLLEKANPNVLSMLWLEDKYYIKLMEEGKLLIASRDLFISKQTYHSFSGYAYGQLHRMTHQKFEGYMGIKRKILVEKFGYDCKNASHLIRLLKMGIEVLNEGKLYVERPDAHQLLEIKQGDWTLEQVKKESDRLFRLLQESYIKTKLPNQSDRKAINQLCNNILEMYYDK